MVALVVHELSGDQKIALGVVDVAVVAVVAAEGLGLRVHPVVGFDCERQEWLDGGAEGWVEWLGFRSAY